MGKFQIGDKVIITAHKEEMEYPCISAKKDLFNLVGTICGACTSWDNGVCLIKLHLKKILVDMIVMECVKMVMDRL